MPELANKLSEFIDQLAKDWDKLSRFYKYNFLLCVFILLAGWLIGGGGQKVAGIPFTFWLYAALLTFAAVLPALHWFCERLYILRIRLRYPIRNIGSTFKFLKVGDSAIIVSWDKQKHLRWIENPRTLYELGFSVYWNLPKYTHDKNLEELIKDGYKIKRGL